MSFNLPYQFQQSGRVVVIQHSHNGHIRVSPNNMGHADGGGGNGGFAQWRIVLEGNHCRLQSTKTNKFLRLWRGGNEIDVNGGTGPFTKFKIHYHSRPNGIKLESDRFPGRFIAVNPNRHMKIGSGGHHCNVWIKREGAKPAVHHVHQPHRAPQIQPTGQGSFNAPYLFQQNNTVIIKSNYGKTLRVSANNPHNGDGNGGTGKFAKWRVILDGNRVIKLQNTHTNKYLRIEGNGAVNVGGGGGPWTRFKYHVHRHPNGVKLESCRCPGKYIAIHPNGRLTHGTGGIHTQLSLWRGGNAPQMVVQQPQANFIVQPQPQIIQRPSGGQGDFNAAYQFQKNNEVVIRSNYGKHLRVSPNNTHHADGNGGTGKFAKWRVILDGNRVIKLQNTHSGKYLRIEGNLSVNVGGGGGPWTRFRYHVHRHPNGVRLESCKIPGTYVAIHPNGTVTRGTGGIHTHISLWRRGGAAPPVVVRQPQPKVIVQAQPQVIIQRQPQVIVQNPSMKVQQRQMEQQMAAEQQQMEQQMASQQQQMQQQMEQMRIQNEMALQTQQQQMELEQQQMQQNMALQQQEMEAQRQLMEQQQQAMSNLSSMSSPTQQEGVAVNPYYGNTNTLEDPPSYPVLNQPISNPVNFYPVEQKEESVVVPPQGQQAANDVFMWLKKLGMDRYYTTFIQNGYDQLDSVGEITREDLKEMGVALGHIKTIVRACITAPFVNRKMRVKCIRYGTYLNQHLVKKMSNGLSCVLQHSENKNKPGSTWLFELLDDNTFGLKHVQSGTWLRIIREDGPVDCRSPFDQWSRMALEKHENSKGIYYIKESIQENYVGFEEPRTFGYNKVGATKKRDGSCRVALEIIQ